MFYGYRICRLFLNLYPSLIAIPLIALIVFSSYCRTTSGAIAEEFCLPLFAYGLFCFLDFLLHRQPLTMRRSLALGIIYGVIIWTKFTMIIMIAVPLLIWFITTMQQKQFRTVFLTGLTMLLGLVLVTVPIIIFYTINHALTDLLHVYFYINLTAYQRTTFPEFLFNLIFVNYIGILAIFSIWSGVIWFTIKYWHQQHAGRQLLIAYLVTALLVVYACKVGSIYYFTQLLPYTILGIVCFLKMLISILDNQTFRKVIQVSVLLGTSVLCFACCLILSHIHWDIGRKPETIAPLQIAAAIRAEQPDNAAVSLFCYKFGDLGFYNALNVLPEVKYFANNMFDPENFPELYAAFNDYITTQATEYVIVMPATYTEEQEFLSQYYQPYSGNLETSTFRQKKFEYWDYTDQAFILLRRN